METYVAKERKIDNKLLCKTKMVCKKYLSLQTRLVLTSRHKKTYAIARRTPCTWIRFVVTGTAGQSEVLLQVRKLSKKIS